MTKVGNWGRGLARDIESLLLPLSLLLPAYYNMSDFPHRNRLKSNETLKPGTETSKMGAKQPFPVLKVKVLYHSGQKLKCWKLFLISYSLREIQLFFCTLFFPTLLSYVFLVINSFSIWGRKSCESICWLQDCEWKSKAPISNAVNNELHLA